MRHYAYLITALFSAMLIVTVLIGKVALTLALLYLALSIVTFILYALDKSAARKNEWRTPESRLHLLSLLGGWPGALIAQQQLRHKSSKRSFQWICWVTVVLNTITFLYFLSPHGQYFVSEFMLNPTFITL